MRRTASVLGKLTRDSLNGGSSMTLGSKGHKLHPGQQRARTPWTAAKEVVPFRVLNQKDKLILEGKNIIEIEATDRMSQIDPLDVLRSAVAQYEFNTSTGKNIFQLASNASHNGRGQRVYRTEWMEGTYEKYVTISSIEFDRSEATGSVFGYVTFHGESTLEPILIDHADVPGWHFLDYSATRAVPEDATVLPPPSIGTDVPVDPKAYRLQAYPYYDVPNPKEFVEKLLKDRGVLPDPPADPNGTPTAPADDAAADDGSIRYHPRDIR